MPLVTSHCLRLCIRTPSATLVPRIRRSRVRGFFSFTGHGSPVTDHYSSHHHESRVLFSFTDHRSRITILLTSHESQVTAQAGILPFPRSTDHCSYTRVAVRNEEKGTPL